MNIKNILSNSAIAICLVAGLGGCKKGFLDLKNPQTLDLKTSVKDLKSLTVATTGVYNQFQSADYYNRTFILIPELIGDNTFISVKNSGRYTTEDNFAVGSGDGYVLGVWAAAYRAIGNANRAIRAGEATEFSESEQAAANQLIGEMYACRAWAHFDLVRFFAQPYNFTADASHEGVPLIIQANDEIISPSRATVAQVYDQIVLDLKKAEGLMNAAKKDGRFSVSAARALLAKVYLYMEKWEEAEAYADKVINEGPYTLLSNTDYVGSWATSFSSESILEVVNTSTDNSGSDHIGYLFEQGGYGDLLVTKDLYDVYTATDVRRKLITPGNRIDGEQNTYFAHKYPNGVTSKDDDIKVLRLSEMYLIRAEARAEQGVTNPAKYADAQMDLNEIILRADPVADPVSLNGDDLVKRIILERRKELAFEGNRLFDLNRKKMDVNHIQSDRTRLFTYPNDRFIMPIPFKERTANPNVTQNPAWVD